LGIDKGQFDRINYEHTCVHETTMTWQRVLVTVTKVSYFSWTRPLLISVYQDVWL